MTPVLLLLAVSVAVTSAIPVELPPSKLPPVVDSVLRAALAHVKPTKLDNEASKASDDIDMDKAQEILMKYGYLKKTDNALETADLEAGLKLFQRYGGLERTGELDEATVALMKKPRCGAPDFQDPEQAALGEWVEKYQTTGHTWPGWPQTPVSISHTSSDNLAIDLYVALALSLGAEQWAAAVDNTDALKWSDIINAQIVSSIVSGDHDGCSKAFDGKNGALAHSFYPPIGEIHFDQADIFNDRANMFELATHELGHTLGLGHSTNRNAVMYGYNSQEETLTQDDINGIKVQYNLS